MTLRDRLRATFARAFELEDSVGTEDLRYQSLPGWDSIGHMVLVAAIEEDFGVELGIEQTMDLKSFDGAVELLEELGAA
ncbi:acyl carrier protein [Kineococcus glutinatus]|uniref:Acyl carrier protein n=1 Tax=Kineococcus glutinatus TaxID=1070872 RepID=A0ABP9HAC6_9ACTN